MDFSISYIFFHVCKHSAYKLSIGLNEFILIERYKSIKNEEEEEGEVDTSLVIMIDFVYVSAIILSMKCL